MTTANDEAVIDRYAVCLLATNHATATDRGAATIADGPAAISDRSAANHGGSRVNYCSTRAVTDCSPTDHGAATISNCSAANHCGTTVGSGPEWANVTRTVHTTSANKCARLHTTDGNKASNKAQDSLSRTDVAVRTSAPEAPQ